MARVVGPGVAAAGAASGLDLGLVAVAMPGLDPHRHHGVGQDQTEAEGLTAAFHAGRPEIEVAEMGLQAGDISRRSG
jgi:hypothetical protein